MPINAYTPDQRWCDNYKECKFYLSGNDTNNWEGEANVLIASIPKKTKKLTCIVNSYCGQSAGATPIIQMDNFGSINAEYKIIRNMSAQNWINISNSTNFNGSLKFHMKSLFIKKCGNSIRIDMLCQIPR